MTPDRLFRLWFFRVRSALLESGASWEEARSVSRERAHPLFLFRVEPQRAATMLLPRTEVAA